MFPARAGMYRIPQPVGRVADRVPRPRGDVPSCGSRRYAATMCSPPARGCTDAPSIGHQPHGVFPARAGMYRPRSLPRAPSLRVPRPRGDVPRPVSGASERPLVFPARAGMDREDADREAVCRRSPSSPQASGVRIRGRASARFVSRDSVAVPAPSCFFNQRSGQSAARPCGTRADPFPRGRRGMPPSPGRFRVPRNHRQPFVLQSNGAPS